MGMKKKNFHPQDRDDTSWEKVKPWYDGIVGEKGHYYHQQVVIPNLLRLLSLDKDSSLVDLGCGQGVLERQIPKNIPYLGIDLAASLIKEAKRYTKNEEHQFLHADVCGALNVKEKFSHGAMVLSLQNMEHPEKAILNASKLLKEQGKLLIVLNHPCFRIPRQTSWGEDPQNKMLYRRVNRYMSPLKIPIHMQPGNEKSPTTFSFHFSLSALSSWFHSSGFAILKIEEWCSDKESTGKRAKSENLAREEFPLFMAILLIKIRNI
jgi:ubiquinone/menaquinone biosynthesis C-methylase UbiE